LPLSAIFVERKKMDDNEKKTLQLPLIKSKKNVAVNKIKK
jgi:hypothetical protein